MQKKNILVILVLLLALQSTSCSSDSDSKTTDNSNETPAATEVSSETETDRYIADYLPEKDFGGYSFRMVNIEEDIFAPEELTGESLNDSVYERNRLIEEEYNVVLTQTQANTWDKNYAVLEQCSRAQTDDFDLIRLIMREAFPATLNHIIASKEHLPYCDPTQPWYLKYMNDNLMIGGEYTLLCTEECFPTYQYTNAVYYNMSIAEDHGIGDLYTLVQDGKWTLDTFMQTAEIAVQDVNGDGTYSIEDDVLSYIGRFDTTIASLVNGTEYFLVKKYSDGIPVFDLSEGTLDVLLKLHNFNNTDGNYYDYWIDLVNQVDHIKHFSENHCLFFIDSVLTASDLREMENDFGLLPSPKKDEAQSMYLSSVCDGYIAVAPLHSSDLERTSIILESLAVESKNIVAVEYKESMLAEKVLRDEQSLAMLDIILDGRTVDMGVTVWMNPVRTSIIDKHFNKGNADFASSVAANQEKIDTTLKTSVEKFLTE